MADWPQLDLDNEYAAGQAYSRLDWIMQYDPYTALLTKDTRQGLCNLFFSDKVLGNKKIVVQTHRGIFDAVTDALNMSPLAELFSHQFKIHLITLVQIAVLSGKPRE